MDLRILIVGQGSYLRRAVRLLRSSGHEVWIHITDSSASYGVGPEKIISRGNPNDSAKIWPKWLSASPVLCANNPFILRDFMLREFPNIYNIHISDVRRNRGLGHLCLVHSLLIGDLATGVSIQRLRPECPVDGSPTVRIRRIPFDTTESFERIMKRLAAGWELALQEDFLHRIRQPSNDPLPEKLGPEVTFELLNRLVFDEGAYNETLAAQGIGNFSRFLPRTEHAVSEFRKFWAEKGLRTS